MHAHEQPKPLLYVVDDEPLLLELAATVLEPSGYEVKSFLDPAEALKAYAKGPCPALLITDFAMHSMNGLELVRECRRINPGQKALLVSGTVDESIYRNGRVKPNRFLAKPYYAKQLVDMVKELLAERLYHKGSA